eukprot:c3935_g1_i1.p1 GENE.c3935_g1_i1~~c3935_g1_i1.p1  ORF type:complete len:325 (+),score=28.25 c3935_g1_i1:97-975(+)
MSPLVVTLLRGLISPWLVFSGEWLIPKLSTWVTARYYNRGRLDSDLTVGLVQNGGSSWHVRTSTEMILVSQLFNLVVAPVLSQLAIHNRCVGVISERFWGPCQNATAFTIDFPISATVADQLYGFVIPVLRPGEVCQSHFDAELCQREVVASIASLGVSKVIYQTLFVLLRALLIVAVHKKCERISGAESSTQQALGGRIQVLLKWVTHPSEDVLTRSIVSLVMIGIVLGGVAPLIWPVVWFGVYSTALLWRCSRQRRANRHLRFVGRRVAWLAFMGQIGFGVWFILANALG